MNESIAIQTFIKNTLFRRFSLQWYQITNPITKYIWKKNLKKLNSVEISVYKCQLSDVFIQLVLLNIKLQVLCTQKYDDLHAINQYLHVMRSTLFEGGFSLSFANIEERLPLIFEKSAETGRY